jgi:pimeloyl-ACP methyl ester carboxylesterase
LALIHPRLFHSLIFIDPVIVDAHPPGPNAALASSLRREQWDSRAKAEAGFKKHPLFKSFDPRVVKAFLACGLKDADDGSVHLTTPKAQEAWSFVRSNFHAMPEDTASPEARYRERLINPDLLPFESASLETFARGESLNTFHSLPQLRPRTLYLFGKHSHINTGMNQRERLLEMTGTGRGGSGGAKDGGTEMKVVDKMSHFLCFESPQRTAIEISDWLAKEMTRWEVEKRFWATLDTGKSRNNMKELSKKWIEMVKRGAAVPRACAKDVAKL